jgi:glycosyltransferase involved in cell wall biosynthesis
MTSSSQPHILIFEPRIKGHHLKWLRYITEDFIAAGFKLTLGVDWRTEYRKLVCNELSSLIEKVNILSVYNKVGKLRKGSKLKALADCFAESGTQEVFVNNLDDIVSHCLRRASVGIFPPKILKGRVSGVYFRPRFLLNPVWPPGNLVKTIGFTRLLKKRWFKNIYLMDEYLFSRVQDRPIDQSFHFLPDPWSGDFSQPMDQAREILKIPLDKFVFLNYGIGDKRKGLHLVIQAMLEASHESRLFLLCAGQISRNSTIRSGLDKLENLGHAKVLNRYVSDVEETLCFCAADVVLLPYINHFGSSGVLSLAAGAGKMVVASDDGLVGKRVLEHKLGLLFSSGNTKALGKSMRHAMSLSRSDREQFQNSALEYALSCNREAFRHALLAPFNRLDSIY